MSTLPCHKQHLSEHDQAFYINQATIDAAHPMQMNRTDLKETAYTAWNVALILVGERHAKHDLTDLVGYLLHANIRLNETLRRQASAVRAGMDATTRASSICLELAVKARAESSPEALASERAANALLTEENERLRAQLQEARDALEAERQPWIPVSEGIPGVRTLAFTPSDNRLLQHRIIPGGMFRQVATEATHWMPLPSDPPKVPA
jgi:hypothetical protein